MLEMEQLNMPLAINIITSRRTRALSIHNEKYFPIKNDKTKNSN